MPETSETAERLRARLKDLNWSQRDLASELKTSAAVVCRILSGERMPSLEMAFRIQNSKVAIPADAWVSHADADDSGPHKVAKTESTDTLRAVVDPHTRRSSG